MRSQFANVPTEVVFTAGMLVLTLSLSIMFGLPVAGPGLDSAAFLGVHYLLPLAGIGVWIMCAAMGQRRDLGRVLLIALPCYTLVLWAHFNIKLWVPLINPRTYDAFYWSTDMSVRPLVDGAFWFRQAITPVIPYEARIYHYGFLFMFYASFCYHAAFAPASFRKLFIAALFTQGLGALAYLAFPALGPFIFEAGANPLAAEGQRFMLDVRSELLRGGPEWLAASGSEHLPAGLAAMPSLHAGGSFLFVWFAYRYARPLLVPYSLLFAYILIVAVANRWHYVIDLPVGVALAAFSIWLAKLFTSSEGSLAGSPSSVLAAPEPAPVAADPPAAPGVLPAHG